VIITVSHFLTLQTKKVAEILEEGVEKSNESICQLKVQFVANTAFI